MLTRVIDSVFDNALKFTDRGGLSIKVEDTGGGITIWFRDTGVGILPENQKLIFERRKEGGLGLYKVKKQLNVLGGDIGLAESTGQGSVFFITLPKK